MITLYTTGCPKCKVLEQKLKAKGIVYGVVRDEKVMMDMGFASAPILTVDGEPMDFMTAIEWIGNYSKPN